MRFRDKYPGPPFGLSDTLCHYLDANPSVTTHLKLANKSRFVLCPVIITSRQPDGEPWCKDEVIGLWFWDEKEKFIKQDFIVNIDSANRSFTCYTAKYFSTSGTCLLRPIAEFFKKYGKDGTYYHREHTAPWMHHYKSMDQIPGPIKPWAQKYLGDQSC